MSAAIAQHISDLSSAELAVRAAAAEQLARLGEEAQPAAVALVRASDDRGDEVRDWATAALEELGPPSTSDLDVLTQLVTHQGVNSTFWAITLLGRLGREAGPAVPTLADAVSQHPLPFVCQRAAWALGQIAQHDIAAIDALTEAAASADARLARLANQALGNIPGASDAL